MHDIAEQIPGRYPVAIAVMQEMSWSWDDLANAPYDLVDEIVVRMNAEAQWRRERGKRDAQRQRAQERSRR